MPKMNLTAPRRHADRVLSTPSVITSSFSLSIWRGKCRGKTKQTEKLDMEIEPVYATSRAPEDVAPDEGEGGGGGVAEECVDWPDLWHFELVDHCGPYDGVWMGCAGEPPVSW